jgi:hypothetical protein
MLNFPFYKKHRNKKARTSQCRPWDRCGVFYALIAGLLEVGVIVPIIVRAVHARAVAGEGDGGVDRMGDEGHAAILQHSQAAGKRSLLEAIHANAQDRSRGIG